MTTYTKSFSGVAMAAVFAFAVLFGATAAHAQVYTTPTGYSVPSGFQSYANGIYYNPSTGSYYNPTTGQYSNLVPLGPATISNGSYVVPAGYNSYSAGGYFNSSTGYYYDPATGFFSTMAPVAQTPGSVIITPTPVIVPGVPNTGAGGNAGTTLSLIVLSAILATGGVVFLTRYTKEA